MKKIKIIGIAASPRSRCKEETLKETVLKCKGRGELEYAIEKMAFSKMISNSEACMMASMYGAVQEGGNIEIVRLNRYFSAKHPASVSRELKNLYNVIKNADGYIFATPVYFGDVSSYLQSFINYLKEKDLLRGRVVGVDSVGAKRNGGQETSIMSALMEVLESGAFICGNGPKTSQYGGTAWAGDLGSIREDNFGIETSIGVGKKVAEAAKLIRKNSKTSIDRLTVSFWLTKDRDSFLKRHIESIIEEIKKDYPEWVTFKMLDLTTLKLRRCLGCSVCPFYFDKPEKYGLFKDRIQNDGLKKIYGELVNTDAIVVSGFNPVDIHGINDIYQVFMERTRQIRRDNFLLTNIPVTAFSYEEIGQANPFKQKVITSFLRHNCIILPPAIQYFNETGALSNPVDKLKKLVDTAINIKKWKNFLNPSNVKYEPIGYSGR